MDRTASAKFGVLQSM